MKKTLVFLLLILAEVSGWAQDNSKGYKLWTDGKLTIEDFQPRNVQSVGFTLDPVETSYLEALIDFKSEKVKKGNLRYYRPVSCTKADLLNSWYAPDYYTSWTVRYNQVIFDIFEASRREIQNQLNTEGADSYNKDYLMRVLKSRLDTFKGESAYGRDTSVIRDYEFKYSEMLDTLVEKEPVAFPGKVRKGYGMGLWIGYNPEVYFGKINDWVSMAHRLSFGFDFYYDRISLGLLMSIGPAGKLKKGDFYNDHRENYVWRQGEKVSSHEAMFKLGYTIYDGSILSFTPAVGFGIGGFDQKTGDYDSDDNPVTSNVDGFRVIAGADFGFKLYREIDQYSMIGEIPLRFSVYGAWMRLRPCDVFSINAGIKISIDSWFAK